MLTLHTAGQAATLGLAGGQLHLLPDHDENPEIWRKRCERAWVRDPDERIDHLRMGEIAFAARLESVFRLLDSEGVHFRFEPGPLPIDEEEEDEDDVVVLDEEVPLGRAETGGEIDPSQPVRCQPISVEYLLLEYARLTDECLSHGDAQRMSVHVVPRLLVQESPTADLERFWNECDGTSSALEIADRLGWPLRQCQATLVELNVKGYVRFADARELLVLSQDEIGKNRLGRGGSRLAAWCKASPPGPPSAEDVGLLLEEWRVGKLPVVLASMEPSSARTLLRRIELVDWDIPNSIERWGEMRKHHRQDTLSELHLIQWQLRSTEEADAPKMPDLLKLARQFQESEWKMRAAVILRTAARLAPEATAVRLEIGSRLIAVGLPDEGSTWVLEACQTLLETGHADKALKPLRNLLESVPTHRDARQLLARVKAHSASGRKNRRNIVLGSTLLVLVCAGAVVKVRYDQAYDKRLSEIAALARDPDTALLRLNQEFPGDDSDRVATLRNTFIGKIEVRKQALRQEWLQEYRKVQDECKVGDPLVGMQQGFDLREPPFDDEEETWPTFGDLLDTIAARMEQSYAELPPIDFEAIDPDSETMPEEERDMLALVNGLSAKAAERERTFTLDGFIRRLDSLTERIETRASRRGDEIARRRAESLLEMQDRLLAAARNYRQAGDIERAVDNYRRLFSSEGSERIRQVLASEKEEAEQHLAALEQARALALAGDHEGAELALTGVCPNPREHALPWNVDSFPSGADVVLGDGSTRETPFRMSTKIGEAVDLIFEFEGYESEYISVDRPGHVMALLSRLPDTWWRVESRITALPVLTGEGHLVTNRAGEITLLDEEGTPVWESGLESLGGIARTPVFLPDRPGSLLVLTEEGVAWLVEVDGGRIEGPWSMDSPPVAGPMPTAEGVLATFADGRTALWTRRLKPEVRRADDAPFLGAPQAPDSHGSDAGLAVLRRSANSSSTLQPPWGEWSVQVRPDRYAVLHATEPERSFYVRRAGEWSFAAWQAPNSSLASGRLWIADDEGLRAFTP